MTVPFSRITAGVIESRRTRALAIALLGSVVAVLVLGVIGRRLTLVDHSWALDFDLNWVAAHRLVDHLPLYDRAASRSDGIRWVGEVMESTNGGPYRSFIGSPFVAFQHAPFTLMPHDTGVVAFRLVTFVAFLAGVWSTAQSLPRRARGVGVAVGLLALAIAYPTIQTLALGQGNGFVVLGLGIAMWASAGARWTVVGIALGLVAALKLPLVLLVAYLVFRGRTRVFVPAVATFVSGLVVAAVVGRPGDLVTWLSDVLPNASGGSSYVGNQSAVAWLARLTTTETRFDIHLPLGAVSELAVVLVVVTVIARVRAHREQTYLPQELGLMVLVVLCAGPLAWDHYFSWVVVPIVLLCHPALWSAVGRGTRIASGLAIAAAVAIFSQAIREPSPAAIDGDWMLRLRTGSYAVAALLLLATTWVLLRRAEQRSDPLSPEDPGERTSVRSAPGADTLAGLWRTRSSSGAPGSTTSATSTSSCRASA